ncbi:MAG: leucine-rich repeat protein [Bacteroidales bacterium]
MKKIHSILKAIICRFIDRTALMIFLRSKVQISLLLFLFYLTSANAQTIFNYNGIYYEVTGPNTVSVTYDPNSNIGTYSGSVTIPSKVINEGTEYTVKSIGKWGVSLCAELTYINIPSSVDSIGEEAFSGCSSLQSINFPASVVSIDNGAFKDCVGLVSFFIPIGVKKISNNVFENCSSLSSLYLGNNITSIGDYSFKGCSSLTSLHLPESDTVIGRYAFEDCSKLNSINIPLKVTNIKDGTFRGCNSLISITLPGGVTSIEYAAFSGCGFSAIGLPETITYIGDEAYANCKNLTSFSFPKSITAISQNCFSGCVALSSINVPNSVNYIGSGAFMNCNSLSAINIPENVMSIGESAFNNCSSLKSINIPANDTLIGSAAFENCIGLTAINIPNGISAINPHTFEGCVSLNSIDLPSNIKTIGEFAFYECNSLISINIPQSVTIIGNRAFFNCINLSSPIIIPEGVTTVEPATFMQCRSVKSFSLPSTLNTISEFAFYDCNSISSLSIPSKVSAIGRSAFEGCSNLTSANIPSGITAIEDYTFRNCSKLTSLSFPSSLLSIGERAFELCWRLESLSLPTHLIYLGKSAFKDCESLRTIHNYSPIPAIIDSSTFGGVKKDICSLFVRSRSVKRYLAANQWKDFINILPVIYDIKTPKIRVLTGTKFTIPVKITDIILEDSISAFQFELKYDSTRLVLTDYDIDSLFVNRGTLFSNSKVPGILKVGYMSDKSFEFEGNLIYLHFRANKSGIRGLDFSKFVLNTENVEYAEKGAIEIIAYGDVDYNQEVEAYDAAIILQKSVGLDPILPGISPKWDVFRTSVADVDGNRIFTAYDAGLVLKKSIDLIDKFPVEENQTQATLNSIVSKSKQTNDADVKVTKEGSNLVLRSYGNLVGLNISFKGEIGILSNPIMNSSLKDIIRATNISENTYNIGFALNTPPVDGAQLMSIPLKADLINDLELSIIVNQQVKSITIGGISTSINPVSDLGQTIRFNPYSNEICFNIVSNESCLATLCDITGRIIQKVIVDTNKKLFIGTVKRGTYIVSLQFRNGGVLSTKILK